MNEKQLLLQSATQPSAVRPPPQNYPAPNVGYPPMNGPNEQQEYQLRNNCGMEAVPQPGFSNPPTPYMGADGRVMVGPTGTSLIFILCW